MPTEMRLKTGTEQDDVEVIGLSCLLIISRNAGAIGNFRRVISLDDNGEWNSLGVVPGSPKRMLLVDE